MTPIKHDPFKNPTVAEALCEIHFGPTDAAFWKSDWAAELKSEIGKSLPVFEKKEIREFRAEIGPEGLKVSDKIPSIPRAIFKNEAKTLLTQVSPGLLTVNEIAAYRGWEYLAADLKANWAIIEKFAEPRSIQRIGLRYINRIPRTNAQDEVGQWLKSSPFIPSHVLKAKSRFMNRMEDSTHSSQRIIVTLAETIEGESRPIVFDIDAISEVGTDATWKAIYEVIERLHDEVWTVFSSGIGPKLKAVLDGSAT